MYGGIAEMRVHLQNRLNELQPGTSALDKILIAVDAHLRHEPQLSDYTTASIRNAGQIPDRLRVRQRDEENAYGAIWRELFDATRADGDLRPDLDVRLTQLLIVSALDWAAEWFDPRRSSLDAVVASAHTLIRYGLTATA
jgi:hypothetical protein